VDDAERTLRRLERIEQLQGEGAGPRLLMDELRALVEEAQAWAAAEGDERAGQAVERCRAAIERRVTAV
jgi:hypothetical protein